MILTGLLTRTQRGPWGLLRPGPGALAPAGITDLRSLTQPARSRPRTEQTTSPSTPETLREQVRDRYAAAARQAATGIQASDCAVASSPTAAAPAPAPAWMPPAGTASALHGAAGTPRLR